MFEGHRDQGRASDAMDSSEFKIGCRDLTNRVNHDEPCPPAVGVKLRDAKRCQQLLELQKDVVLPSSEHLR